MESLSICSSVRVSDFVCSVAPDIDLDNNSVCPEASDRHVQQLLVRMVEKHNLHQVHNTPTIGDHKLDLGITTYPTPVKASVSGPGLSHHDLTLTVSDYCIRPYQTQQSPQEDMPLQQGRLGKDRVAASGISEKVTKLFRTGENVSRCWDCFQGKQAACHPQPHTNSPMFQTKRLPWLNGCLCTMIQKKKRLHRQAKKTGDWSNYLFNQKECKQQFRKAE